MIFAGAGRTRPYKRDAVNSLEGHNRAPNGTTTAPRAAVVCKAADEPKAASA